MLYDQFGLVITDRCVAACKFCGWRCSPGNRGIMDLDLAREAMRQAFELGLNRRLGITGGEAFLYPELVRELLVYAKALGYKIGSVAANGFWGGWADEKIDAMLESLEGYCDLICFSYDSFHAEYIPEASLWKAVRMTARHGIPFTISMADVKSERGAGPFLKSMSEEALRHKYKFYALQQIGNAMNLPDEIFCRDTPREDTFCDGAGLYTMLYDGRVFPCCNPGVFDTELALGNLREKTLKEMIDRNDTMRRVKLLCNQAYFQKLIACAEAEGLIQVPEKVVSGCEICHRLFRDKAVMARLAPVIDELYQEMVVQNFLKPKEG